MSNNTINITEIKSNTVFDPVLLSQIRDSIVNKIAYDICNTQPIDEKVYESVRILSGDESLKISYE